MTKELEALKTIGSATIEEDNCVKDIYYEEYDILKQTLTELKAIKESKSSEALRMLDDINYLVLNEIDDLKNKELWKSYFTTIKQALLRTQELEKVIDIINEKCVGIFQLTCCKNVDEYNDLKFVDYEKLTKEEFDLLKRWLNEKN